MSDLLVGYITVPVYALADKHFTGFRQTMVDAGPHAVSVTAGLGGDAIWMELEVEAGKKRKMRYLHANGRDMLAATLKLIGHADHHRVPTTEGYR